MDSHLPDPARHATDNAAQLAAMIAAAAQTLAHLRERRNHPAAQHHADIEYEASRRRWEPALDPQWCRLTDTVRIVDAWTGAAPYADRNAATHAATANCTDRLRDLHPNTMARYDKLRANGAEPLDAMARLAPALANPPTGREEAATETAAPSSGRDEVAVDTTQRTGTEEAADTPSAVRPAALTPGSGIDLAALTIADRERALAAADLAQPDQPATPAVDEHTLATTTAARNRGHADTATAHAVAIAARTPAQFAAAAYPHSIGEALAARPARAGATAVRAAHTLTGTSAQARG